MTVKLSQRSRLAREHLKDAIRTASGLGLPATQATRDENERCKKQLHLGARWTLNLLGVGQESLLYRFVMERFQEWVKSAERRTLPAPATRKGPHRVASEKGRRRA